MKPLWLTKGIPPQVRMTSVPSWWAVRVTELDGAGVGGGAMNTAEVRGTHGHKVITCDVTLTQLLHVTLPALQQLHRLR